MDFCRAGVYINCNYANLLFQGCTIDSDPVRIPDSVGFKNWFIHTKQHYAVDGWKNW